MSEVLGRFAKRLSNEGFTVYLIDILTSEGLITACGDADDIADPMVCDALVDSSPIKGLITVRHYPGARHGFDIQGAPSVIDIGNGMTVGYQEAAANGAWKELTAFIGHKP